MHLTVAMTVYLPVWHWHCTRARFTVLVSCSDEFAVHSCPLLCLQKQGRIQPVSLGRAISMIFGSQVSLQVHYCKRDEAYFITLLWQKMDGKVALYRECCFPNCSKSWQKKLLSEVLGGPIVPIATPRIRPFAEAGCETCERIVLLLIFISQQYHGNESSKVHFKLRYLCVLPYVTVELRHPWQV